MQENLEDLYNNFEEPVCLINSKGAILFKNKSFIKAFGDTKDIKRLTHKFHFDLCVLNSEKITSYSPFEDALIGGENFSTYAIYQATTKSFLNYKITGFSIQEERLLIFYDITDKIESKRLSEENENLEAQNAEFVNTNSQAQNQAIKMAFLNRISSSLREQTDISTMTKAALKELSIILGSFKAYYASIHQNGFEIKDIYPAKYKSETGTIINYDNETISKIQNKKNTFSSCIKEYQNAHLLDSPAFRILMPIWNKNRLLGVMALLTTKKSTFSEEKDFLVSISAQLGSAMMQAYLFDEIKKQKNELEKALKELKETQLQLINSEKMASLGQLVASVAHEINTPLASIHSNNETIKKIAIKYDLPQMLLEINKIDNEAINRINNIVKSLKRFVRLDEARLQKACINKELDLTLQLLEHKTKNKITINKIYSQIPPINCYPDMLNQVFTNLLMNSIQSIKEKGEIFIKTEYENSCLKVKIRDTGCGIKDPSKIFDVGYTTKKPGEGTGLGLAISKKIIEKHQGKLEFNKELKQGCEFILTIPDLKT